MTAIRTSNWAHILVQAHDYDKWEQGWLDLARAESNALLAWSHFSSDGNEKQAELHRQKYLRLRTALDEYPDWERRYEWQE